MDGDIVQYFLQTYKAEQNYLLQVYEDNRDYYHAVAVIKRGSLTFEDGKPVRTLSDLRGKHACFAGVGTQVSCAVIGGLLVT